MTKKILKKIKAGSTGTKYMTEKYGNKLVCVRYIYDSEKLICTKTIELIEEIHPWNPNKKRIPGNKIMHLRVEYGEKYIGQLIKSCGGRWNKEKKYWELPYREVISIGLESRIIDE